jgi:hypothetical protein
MEGQVRVTVMIEVKPGHINVVQKYGLMGSKNKKAFTHYM